MLAIKGGDKVRHSKMPARVLSVIKRKNKSWQLLSIIES